MAALGQLDELTEDVEKQEPAPKRGLLLSVLVGVVGVAGSAALVASTVAVVVQVPAAGRAAGIAVLLGAALLAERYPVPMLALGSGGVSLAAVFIVAVGYLYGWAPAALVACATRGVFEVVQRRPLDRLVYNCSTYALAGGVAGLAATVAPQQRWVGWLIVDVLLGSTAFYVVDVVLIATVIAVATKERVRAVLDGAVRSTASVFAIMFTVSLMLDVLWQRQPVLSAALLGPCLAIALYQRSASRERRAMELALTDPLTELGNYRAFQVRLEELLNEADERRVPVSLCVLDLDDFKLINDRHGHQAGDRALASIAACLRQDGEAFRLGGDELALLLPDCSEETASQIAGRVVERIAAGQSGRTVSTTVSAGVATYPGTAVDRSQLVRAADRALYTAKASGRNAVRVFRPDAVEFSERRIAAQIDRRSRLAAASCLAEALEARDAYTGDHSQAVAHLAFRLALQLDLSSEDAELLRLAGRVHDLGKLAIAEELLRKQEALTDHERRTIQTHSEIGFRMLSALGIEPVARWVRHHHERWDGTGYPDGLRGEEIPIGSRILAVADAYQAMTSTRTYQDSIPAEQALAELERCAHTQFDPLVVHALEHLLVPEQAPERDETVAVA